MGENGNCRLPRESAKHRTLFVVTMRQSLANERSDKPYVLISGEASRSDHEVPS
jgi:hypothetical protein